MSNRRKWASDKVTAYEKPAKKVTAADCVTVYIGADPGLTGSIAIYTPDPVKDVTFIDIEASEIADSKKGRREVNALLLQIELEQVLRAHRMSNKKLRVFAAIERVASRPQQASQTTFSMGDSFGSLRSVIETTLEKEADFYAISYFRPQTWKGALKLTSNKEDSVKFAKRACTKTAEFLTLKKHHDRAEAFCLAYYLEQRHIEYDENKKKDN